MTTVTVRSVSSLASCAGLQCEMLPPVGAEWYGQKTGPYLAKGGVPGGRVRVPPVSRRGWAYSGAQAWLRRTLTSGGSSGWVARAACRDGGVELHLTESAVMTAMARWLIDHGATDVEVYPALLRSQTVVRPSRLQSKLYIHCLKSGCFSRRYLRTISPSHPVFELANISPILVRVWPWPWMIATVVSCS